MDKIALIRQEIERRKKYESENYHDRKADGRPNDGWTESFAIMGVLEELLSFIDTLSKKSVEELDDHEIIDYVHSKFYYDKDFDGYGHGKFRPVLTREDLISFARHFAKWGADHAPLPEDTVLFNKGIAEGKRLMLEDAVECSVYAGKEGDKWIVSYIGNYESMLKTCKSGDKVRIIVLPKED